MQELEDRSCAGCRGPRGRIARQGRRLSSAMTWSNARLPAERAGDDFAGERSIALVGQGRVPRARQRVGKVGVPVARPRADASYAALSRAGAIIARRCESLYAPDGVALDGRPETRRAGHDAARLPAALEHAQHAAVARDDFESLAGSARTMVPGASATHGRRQLPCDGSGHGRRERAGDERPRLKASHQVVDTLGRQRPVDGAFRLGDLGSVGHERRGPAGSRAARPPASLPRRHREADSAPMLGQVVLDLHARLIADRSGAGSCRTSRRHRAL